MSVSKRVGAGYGTESLPHGPERQPRSHTEPFMRFLLGTEPNLLYLVPDQAGCASAGRVDVLSAYGRVGRREWSPHDI